jgi:hypothetical protein
MQAFADTLEAPVDDSDHPPAVRGGVRVTLQLEGLAVLAASAMVYGALGGGWGLFALLFLTPDLSMLGYLVGRRTGALVYNIGHSYLTPALSAAFAYAAGRPDLATLALIWTAHIGFDRMLGYGLKYGSGFGDTHLGRFGKGRGAGA